MSLEAPVEPAAQKPRRLGEHLVEAGLLSLGDLVRALAVQKQTKEPLGRILISLGFVRRYDVYQALSRLWNLPFIDLIARSPDPELCRRVGVETLVREQFVPIVESDDGLEVAVTHPPDEALDALIRETLGTARIRYFVTTDWDVDHALRQIFRSEILDGATYGLYFRAPHESAYTVLTPVQFAAMGTGLLALLTCLYVEAHATVIGLNLVLNIAFAASILFKFVTSLYGASAERHEAVTAAEVAALTPEDLPHYSILVPVYREAEVVGPLLASLGRLDYPKDKLEILILLEENDHETIAAAKAAAPPGNVRFVMIPDREPKTKPKACNVGLYFARGEFLVIYDAEDRPEPDQLKKAVAAFRKGPAELVCVQAALNYYNSREGFLPRMFTLEYSYWFDYMLPGLDRMGLPIPLGGTSNHFRTEFLRNLQGWDPFNVTEDADLGVRASARGYRVGVINSTTYEEAPTRVRTWLRQRSRWIKGYMQTGLVYLRSPLRLVRQLGPRRALGFLFLVAGTPVTFLLSLPMWAVYLTWLVTKTTALDSLFPPVVLYLSLFNLLLGNGIAVYLGMLAVFKRKRYELIAWSLLTPVYWALHSLAAWKALGQLVTRPFYWEKTTHGLSKQCAPEPAGSENEANAPLVAAGAGDSVRGGRVVRQP